MSVQASLVWSDYPGSIVSSRVLVNDLTLAVSSASSGLVYGNNRINPAGAQLVVNGVALPYGHASFGATLDMTPPMVASVFASASCTNLGVGASGKVVAFSSIRGCTRVVAAKNAQAVGAVGVILPGGTAQQNGDNLNDPLVRIPVVSVAPTSIRSIVSAGSISLGMTMRFFACACAVRACAYGLGFRACVYMRILLSSR